MICSGAQKLKNNCNANSESGSYYNELVEKNKKAKPVEALPEIEKVIKTSGVRNAFLGYFPYISGALSNRKRRGTR